MKPIFDRYIDATYIIFRSFMLKTFAKQSNTVPVETNSWLNFRVKKHNSQPKDAQTAAPRPV